MNPPELEGPKQASFPASSAFITANSLFNKKNK
jgi:hypothetical protein